jgi:hypothetical protein
LSVVECHLHVMFLDLMWSVLDVKLGENVYNVPKAKKMVESTWGRIMFLLVVYKFSFGLFHYVEKFRTIY